MLGSCVDLRFNNKLQAAVQGRLEELLSPIPKFDEITLAMKCGQGKRDKQFLRDTAMTMHHKRNGMRYFWCPRFFPGRFFI